MNLAFMFVMTESRTALFGQYIVPDWWGMMIALHYKDTYRTTMTHRERLVQILQMNGYEIE